MTTIPSNNTNDELKANEEQCYNVTGPNATTKFQTFRLYLPTFPREDINTLIEIPFLASRKFCLNMENYLFNTLQLIMTNDYDNQKMIQQIRMESYNKFVTIHVGKINLNINYKKLKNEYLISNLKNRVGKVIVDIFHDIPASQMNGLLENSRYYLEMQCGWFVNLVGFFHFPQLNMCVRVMESCCLNLHRLNEIFLREREIIDQGTKAEVCLFLLSELLVAVDFLHERGITHRFLNPEHVYFDFRGHVKLGNIYNSMNVCRELNTLLSNWSLSADDEIGFSYKLYQMYLDPEVLRCLLQGQRLEAYLQMDCMADIFVIGIMLVESISGINLLSITVWNEVYSEQRLPQLLHTSLVDIFLRPDMQLILRHRVSVALARSPISAEMSAVLLLMLQPKQDRMRGLRLAVQRHRNLPDTMGWEFKLRMSLVRRHPAFARFDLDKLLAHSSPLMRLLAVLNSS